MNNTTVWTDPLTESVAKCVMRHRRQYAHWLECIDCLRIDEDLPDYREAYDVPADYGRDYARAYILGSMMESHYDDLRPELDCPFGAILSEGFSTVNWLEIARFYFSRTPIV